MRKLVAALLFALSLAPAFAQAPPAVPALPDSPRITSYSLSGSVCTCSVGWALYGDSTDYGSWIEVWLTTGSGVSAVYTKLTALTDYTITSATGPLATIPRPITNAVLTLAAAKTGTLQIVGSRRPRRTTQFAENRGVAARDLNQALTDIIATQRETWDRTNDTTGRALLTPPGDTTPGLLPNATQRAGGVLGFDTNGNPIAMTALTGLGNVIGPNSSTVGHIATFGNTGGTILLDGGLIGAGDMTGPASSVANHAPTFSGTTGKILKDSGLTLTPSTGTVTITNGKTLAVDNSLEFAGTDSTVMTFPTTSATIARTDAANTFTGHQTIEGVTTTGATGTGKLVFDTAPTFGAVTVTSVNKMAVTAPATASTLAVADGKTLTANSTLTLAGTDSKTLTVSNSGTLAGGDAFTLAIAAGKTLTASSSLTLAGTDSKTLTVSNSGTLAGGDAFTLAIAAAKTLTVSNSLTLTGTDSTSFAFPTTSDTVTGNAATQTLTNKTLTAPVINGGTATALTGLGIRSSGSGAFDLTLANTENLTAGRTLTLTVNNAARSINISGNVTTAADFITSGANALTLTTTGTTNVTLPISGTLATRDTANTFSSTNTFSALNQFTDIKFSSGKLYPTSDSTTALQITKADGTTRIVNFDTTNARVGINKTAGAFDLDVNGATNIGGTLTFGTLSSASLGASTSTITGLTANNSPNSSNDYLLYYSASDGAIRKCTLGSCASAAAAGVSSLNGLTGGLSIASTGSSTVTAAGTTVTIANPSVQPQGRLTLATGTPVTTTNQSAKTTIFYDNYVGNTVPYYNGSTDTYDTIAGSEVSAVMVSAASAGQVVSGQVYDVWWVHSGANRICIAMSASTGGGGGWASDTAGSATARGTGYSQLDTTTRAYITNKNAITNCFNGATNYGSVSANQATYLGTFYATANGQTEDSTANRYLFNQYNVADRALTFKEPGNSWNYTTTTYRAYNNGANSPAFNLVRGTEIEPIKINVTALCGNSSSGMCASGIGIDVTNATSADTCAASATSGFVPVQCVYNGYPGVGKHTFNMLEISQAVGTSTFYGVNTVAYVQAGMTGIARQ